MNQPTIFLLEEDDDTRLLFRKMLEEKGYNVFLAVDEKDAFQRATDGLVKSDLIMINLLRKSEEEMLNFGNHLRKIANLNIPLVIIAAEYNQKLEGKTTRAGENEYVIYLGDGEELFDLLSELIK
ncbi:MAG: hypothetical protein M3209_00870 [Acidobacteriota bacterium]|nr:hypothetical protein [Acidobacteriota bacterium]